MRLFGKVTSAITQHDRAEWLTAPFDLYIGPAIRACLALSDARHATVTLSDAVTATVTLYDAKCEAS